MLEKIAAIGLATLTLAPVPALAQAIPPTAPAASGASAIPNRATVRWGTHGTRSRHRSTLNRQKARATAERARQVRAAPKGSR